MFLGGELMMVTMVMDWMSVTGKLAGNDVTPPSFYAPLVMHAVKKWKNEADVVCKKPVQLAETDFKCSNSDQYVCYQRP